MGILQRLLRKEEYAYDETLGITTGEDLKRVAGRDSRTRRKDSYKLWICRRCDHQFFYSVIRCPLCESRSVKEEVKVIGNLEV